MRPNQEASSDVLALMATQNALQDNFLPFIHSHTHSYSASMGSTCFYEGEFGVKYFPWSSCFFEWNQTKTFLSQVKFVLSYLEYIWYISNVISLSLKISKEGTNCSFLGTGCHDYHGSPSVIHKNPDAQYHMLHSKYHHIQTDSLISEIKVHPRLWAFHFASPSCRDLVWDMCYFLFFTASLLVAAI